MYSHMLAQTTAIERNTQVEMLVDLALRIAAERWTKEQYLERMAVPEHQKDFIRDDCSDVWDHFLELQLRKTSVRNSGALQIWGQTTCYKGNVLGKPESNKTYEIRETLMEALTLQKWLIDERVNFVTFHVTFGPSSYSYGWIKDAKTATFDISFYPSKEGNIQSIYQELANVFSHSTTLIRVREDLRSLLGTTKNSLAICFTNLCEEVYQWGKVGFPENPKARQQASLLSSITKNARNLHAICISESQAGGAGIKQDVQDVLLGKKVPNRILKETVSVLTSNNPFIGAAIDAIADWPTWRRRVFGIPSTVSSLNQYVDMLWRYTGNERLVVRRLLLRFASSEHAEYIQDLGIEGITEHNLYGGDHNDRQIEEITRHIVEALVRNNVTTPGQLDRELESKVALETIKSSLNFETKNGTNLKPSLYYIELALSDAYSFKKRGDTALPPLIGYQSTFSSSKVAEYSNMKVVVRKSGSPAKQGAIAIIKAKFFRKQELPRRVKEEAYVGLTARYAYDKSGFRERIPKMPFIMFMDIDKVAHPPEYAIRALMNAGWRPVFSVDSLRKLLDSINPGQGLLL